MMGKLFELLVKISKIFSRQNLYKYLECEIDKIDTKELNVLNIGSGGQVGALIKQKLNTVNIISIDIDEKRQPDIVMSATNLQFDDNSFDIVFMMEVLEHIEDPFTAIDEIYRTLKPNGKLIISTPFIFGIHDKPYDYFRFTKYGLSTMFQKFSVSKIKNRNDYIHTILVLHMRLLMSEYKSDKIIGAIFIFLILLTYPIIYIVSKNIKSNNVTSGYFCVVTK